MNRKQKLHCSIVVIVVFLLNVAWIMLCVHRPNLSSFMLFFMASACSLLLTPMQIFVVLAIREWWRWLKKPDNDAGDGCIYPVNKG